MEIGINLNKTPRIGAARMLALHFGQMGDAVLALPAARALQRAYAESERVMLTSLGGAQIFRLAGGWEVVEIDRRRWKNHPAAALRELPGLWRGLRRRRFELAVDLHSYKETNLLAWSLGIPRRAAMLRPTRSWPGLINLKPPPDDPAGNLLERYCRVLEPLGIEVSDRTPRLEIPAALLEAEREWRRQQLAGCCLAIFPGAGHASRRWPIGNFQATAQEFLARHAEWSAMIFTGPEEDERELAGLRALPRTVLRPGLALDRLAAAFALSELALSNDSGPAHLAAAAGARVVVIGAIRQFDPVGRVTAVRSPGPVKDLPVEPVSAALESAMVNSNFSTANRARAIDASGLEISS